MCHQMVSGRTPIRGGGEPPLRQGEEVTTTRIDIERLQSLAFSEAPAGLVLVSIENGTVGRLLSMNRASLALAGLRPDSAVLGEGHGDRLRRLAAGEIQDYTDSVRIVHPGGRELRLEVEASVIRGSDGEPVCALLRIVDATERELFAIGLQGRRAIATALAQVETVASAISALPAVIGKALGMEAAVGWSYDAATGLLHARDQWHAPDAEADTDTHAFIAASRSTAFRVGDGVPGQAWAERACLVLDELPPGDPRELGGLRSVLTIPIALDDEPVAVLEFASRRPPPAEDLIRPVLNDLACEATQLIGAVWGEERRRPSQELLLVEDNEFIARLVREMLVQSYEEPLDLFHAKTLAEARERLASTRPACVLLDLNLPDAAGLATLMDVRSRAPEVPIVVLTGEEDERVAVRAVKEGAQDYLMKRKIDLHGLARSIRYAIERKGVEQDLLAHRLRHPLTQLPTRVLFLDQVRVALSTSGPGEVAVLVLDVDRFRIVNNSLGHEVGDRLLVEVAGRLRTEAGADALVAGLGGDSFAVLVTGPQAELTAVGLAGRLCSAMGFAFQLDDQRLVLSATVGVALNRSDTASAEALLSDADTAMSRAKDLGGGQWEVFEESVRASLRKRLADETELRAAIQAEELSLHYQPIVALADRRLLAFEALVRWEHPERGIVGPGEFIPLAEHAGLIGALGSWVLRRACQQLRAWRSQSSCFDDVIMHVNLSAAQLQDGGLVNEVEAVLAEEGLAPGDLCLEVTETSVIEDLEGSIETLETLRARGVHIALDDFGTGYSSLAYLSRLPVDSIKLDRSFLVDAREERESAVVALVGRLATALGMPAIAEGIESPDDIARLRDLGYARGQGYWLGMPEPADAAVQFVTSDGVWEVSR